VNRVANSISNGLRCQSLEHWKGRRGGFFSPEPFS